MSGYRVGYWEGTNIVQYILGAESEDELLPGETFRNNADGPPPQPQPRPKTTEELAQDARDARDDLLLRVYDKGINMALRALRMADPQDLTQIAYIQGKIQELDQFATELQSLPEQPGFPEGIVWPTQPVVEDQ